MCFANHPLDYRCCFFSTSDSFEFVLVAEAAAGAGAGVELSFPQEKRVPTINADAIIVFSFMVFT